jgi:hypothetical protein
LAAPTPTEEVKQRPIFNKNKEKIGELDYVDARFTMERFDTALGPENWQDEYRVVPGGIVGRIGVFIVGSGWVWKEDVGTESNIEAVKGSFSDAFKRAAVKWGVARDLYDARDEQTDRPTKASTAAPRPMSPAPVGAGSPTPKPHPFDVDPATAPWVCPEHNAVVAFPQGVSAAGRAYEAFYACPQGRDCPHRAPRGLRVRAEHLALPQPEGSDDLPF